MFLNVVKHLDTLPVTDWATIKAKLAALPTNTSKQLTMHGNMQPNLATEETRNPASCQGAFTLDS